MTHLGYATKVKVGREGSASSCALQFRSVPVEEAPRAWPMEQLHSFKLRRLAPITAHEAIMQILCTKPWSWKGDFIPSLLSAYATICIHLKSYSYDVPVK